MNTKFYGSLLLIAMGISLNSLGQISYNKRMGGPIGDAPKAGSFDKSGYTVDDVTRSTGTVNINIPLYEVKAHDINVPISISYSALGLKVGQEAGAPGMGWELNAGGRIVRQINGLDDETPNLTSINSTSPISLDPDNNLTDRNTLRQIAMGNYDYAWDVYSYSIPGASGKFTKNGLTFPYDPTFKFNSQNYNITTGNGLVHSFELGDVQLVSKRKVYRQKSDGTYNMEEVPTGLQWVLDTKEQKTEYNLSMITSPRSRDTVKFEYELLQSAGPQSGIIGRTRIKSTEQLPLTREIAYNNASAYHWTDQYNKYMAGEPILNQTKIDIVKHRRIKRILFAMGKVDFEYNASDILGRDVLKRVKIYQKTNGVYKQLKQYFFNYDSDVTYGHYLKDMIILDADSANAGVWKFDYHGYTGTGIVGKLMVPPNVESMAQDRWGYYNGQTYNKTLIENPENMINMIDRPHLQTALKDEPSTPTSHFVARRPETTNFYSGLNGQPFVNVNFANRSTNLFNMISGTIKKVTTPTGETVNYEYESNKFYVHGASPVYPPIYADQIIEGGGIRIKSITRNDGIMFSGRTLSKRSFTYGMGTYNSQGDTEVGYGVVNVPGVITTIQQRYEYNDSGTSFENLMIFSHPLNDLSLYAGSYAYYPSVVESTYTGPYIDHQTAYYYDYNVPTDKWTNHPFGNTLNQYFENSHRNFGLKFANTLGQPLQMIEYNGTRSGNTKARVTTYSYSNYLAPLNSPKLYSFYGGVNGSKIGQYNTYFTVCQAGIVDFGATFNCTTIATVPNLDPVGFLDVGAEIPEGWYPGKYYGSTVEYSTMSMVYKLTEVKTTTYNTIYVDPFVTTTKTEYNNTLHMQPSKVIRSASSGTNNWKVTRMKYAYDFLSNTIPGVDLLRSKNIMTEPVEELEMVGEVNPSVLAGRKKIFTDQGGLIYNSNTYYLNTLSKTIPLTDGIETSSYYEPEYSFISPDQMGNTTLTSKTNGPKTAVIWGYNQQYPVAEVSNVYSMDEVAYTDFQSDNRAEWKGYWSYSGTSLLDETSPAADKVYNLQTGAITKTLTSSGKKYLLAYWYKYGSTVTVTGGTVGGEVIRNRKGNWIFAEREITSGTSLSISGTGYIDELRLCPVESMMKTYTYSPGIGITKMQDEKGQSVTYEYDNEQRLKVARDHQGNILKAYKYNIGSDYKQVSINN